jgi:hypothetical protein
MSRTLVSASALLILMTGLASARDLVPGSDLGVREAQSLADRSVIAGPAAGETRVETSYGYQADRTVRFESFRPSERSGDEAVPSNAARGPLRTIVPGSDSF